MIPFWFVAFHDGDGGAPWVRWVTRPGFRHCFAFGFDAHAGAWVLVDPHWSHLAIRIVPRDWADAWITAAGRTLTMVRIRQHAAGRVRPRLLVTCAGAISGLVGLGGSNWRPHVLYRSLLAEGAEPIGQPHVPPGVSAPWARCSRLPSRSTMPAKSCPGWRRSAPPKPPAPPPRPTA